MYKINNFLFVLLIYFISNSVVAQSVRKYSNEFLNIGVDAGAMAMGNAVVSFKNDVNASYWNPAGLVNINDNQLSLMHAAYFANIAQYEFISFAKPIDNQSAIGFSLIRFGVDDIMDTTELIDEEGNIDYNNIDLFSAADYALQFSYARRPTLKEYSLGVNAKLLYRRIGNFASAYGFGFDAGWQLNKEQWHYGIMLRDITTTFNYWSINEKEFDKIKDAIPDQNQELPETTEISLPKLQAGISKDWELSRDISLLSALDINIRFTQTNDIINTEFASFEPAIGFQADYLDMVFLRVGVNNWQKIQNFDNSSSINFQPNVGVGFNYRGIQVDYALTNIASIGNALYSHIFSLKLDFEAFRN